MITLSIDQKAFSFFNQLRTVHFPKERNYLDAHLTLFHKLPDLELVFGAIADLCDRTSSFSVQISGLLDLGSGVAFRIDSKMLDAMRESLKRIFLSYLSKQDLQKFRPHITVQNKVNRAEAQKLMAYLHTDFQSFECLATGIVIWEYEGGPWKLRQSYSFEGR